MWLIQSAKKPGQSLQSLIKLAPSSHLTKTMTPPKRKADNPGSVAPASKRVATSPSAAKSDFDPSRVEEKYGIVQREFYPAQISNERCEQYNQNQIPRPIEVLEKTLKETASRRDAIDVGDTVVYWYKRDLRLHDNKALSKASERARSKGVPLVCLFVISPQDYQAHLTSSARVDLELRTLAIMKEDLAALNIPLLVNVQDKRETIPDHIIALCRSWNTKHVYCSIEYEVDELRRETLIINKCLQNGISFNALHDDVIVPPGELSSGAGKQYSVYSPWYRAWMAHIHKYPQILSEFPAPTENPPSTKEKFKPVFESAIPPAPENKTLTEEEKHRFQSLWPAGEHEALARLQKFLKEKITKYKETRNFPAENSTALLSPHFAAGTLSARAAVRNARDANSTKKLDGGNPGIVGWVSEVAWRDFYKHVLAHWPYVWWVEAALDLGVRTNLPGSSMNKSFKYEYSSIGWSYNMEHFQKWTEGMTGFPIGSFLKQRGCV